jgi:hypothetical protein
MPPPRRVNEGLDLAAVAKGGDHHFLDKIGDGQRFSGPMRATVAGAAERPASLARISRDKTACGHQQQLDSVLARRGQAGAQAGHGAPGWRLVQEFGRYALVAADPPSVFQFLSLRPAA